MMLGSRGVGRWGRAVVVVVFAQEVAAQLRLEAGPLIPGTPAT